MTNAKITKQRNFGCEYWQVETGTCLADFQFQSFDRYEDAEHYAQTGEIRNPHVFTVGQLNALYSL